MKIKNITDKFTNAQKAELLSGKSMFDGTNIEDSASQSIKISYAQSGHTHMKDYLEFDENTKEVLYPSANALGCSFDVTLAREVAKSVGEDLRVEGRNMGIISGAHPKRNMMINSDAYYYSEDPYHAMRMCEGYAQGLKLRGIGVIIDGYGLDDYKDNRYKNSIVDSRAMHELYDSGFISTVRRIKPQGVIAPIGKINGVSYGESKEALEDFRKKTGFGGIAFSPYFGGIDSIKAINAGVLPEMRSESELTKKEILSAIENEIIDTQTSDELINRLLSVAKSLYTLSKVQFMHDTQVGVTSSKRAALECFVLLKNEENILPLKINSKVAVIGKNAVHPFEQIKGRYWVNPTGHMDFMSECAKYSSCEFMGEIDDKLNLSEEALKDYDTFMVFIGGGNEQTEFEYAKNITSEEVSTVKALKEMGKKVIVVFSSAASVEIKFAEYADAIIYDPVCGEAASQALAEIIFGLHSPSGKLNQSFAYSYEDLPSYKYTSEENNVRYMESVLSGYRFFTLNGKKAAFPFGHGLTYSSFEYSSERCSFLKKDGNVDLAFDITNTGHRQAKEVVQVYVSDSSKRAFKPGRELKYFEKVDLKPAETYRVNVRLNIKDFCYFDTDKNMPYFYSGQYNIQIGSSSEDIRIDIPITILSDEKYDEDFSIKDMPSYYPEPGRRLTVANNEYRKICPHWESAGDNSHLSKENKIVKDIVNSDSAMQKVFTQLLEDISLTAPKKPKGVEFKADKFTDMRKYHIENMSIKDLKKYYAHKMVKPKKGSEFTDYIFGEIK